MSDPKPIGSIINRERKRLWDSCPGLGLQSLFARAAGPEISGQTTVIRLKDGVLTVGCSSGAWALELRLNEERLREKLNRLGPPAPVREIRFISGARPGFKARK